MANSPATSAAHRFGLNRNIAVLMAVILVVGTGEELWIRFLPAYLEDLGGGVWVVAAYGALFNLLDSAYQYPGGWAADRLGLMITIGCCLLAVLLWVVLYREGPARPHEPIHLAGVWRSFDTRLRRLLVADILARWAEGIPKVFVVIYCTQNLGLSAVLFGWLMTVQRLTNLVAYLPAIGLGDRPNRKPFVLATLAFFALFPLILANVAGLWGLVV